VHTRAQRLKWGWPARVVSIEATSQGRQIRIPTSICVQITNCFTVTCFHCDVSTLNDCWNSFFICYQYAHLQNKYIPIIYHLCQPSDTQCDALQTGACLGLDSSNPSILVFDILTLRVPCTKILCCQGLVSNGNGCGKINFGFLCSMLNFDHFYS
jgi:hypothetical protein